VYNKKKAIFLFLLGNVSDVGEIDHFLTYTKKLTLHLATSFR